MATKTCPYCAEEIQAEAIKCKHCGSWLGPGQDPGEPPDQAAYDPGYGAAPARGFRRSSTDRMLAGVCGGLGRFIGIETIWVRLVFAIGSIPTGIFPGVILYIILAVVVPSDDDPRAWTG